MSIEKNRREFVDIGTEWNLKETAGLILSGMVIVDIGTEWNLKQWRQQNEYNRIYK